MIRHNIGHSIVGVHIKKVTKKYWWQYNATVATYPLHLLPLDQHYCAGTRVPPS